MSNNEHGYCPECGADWDGDSIPKKDQQYYRGTKWGRQIGIDGALLGIYDGIVAYKCPDCEQFVPRGNSGWALEMFEKFKEVENSKK